MMELKEMNSRYAIGEQLRFAAGQGGLPVAEFRNASATATVGVYGGHVMQFQPHDTRPVLSMSAHSRFEEGQAIRGGIPVCWPWFGACPADPKGPSHGFVRRQMWQVAGTGALSDGEHWLLLRIADDPKTREFWPHAFELNLRVTVGRTLSVELIAHNTDNEPVTITAALHTYFNISAAAGITIRGLEGCEYIDTVGVRTRRVQEGEIAIRGETDRIYLDTTGPCTILDPGFGRRIVVAKTGSRSTVVWNPWIAKSLRLQDFGAEEYHTMVCIETANADSDARTLAPGGSHRLQALIAVEPMPG